VASPGNENADGDDDENVWKVSVPRGAPYPGHKYHPRGANTIYIVCPPLPGSLQL
jgi:hypothetical protein